jgi:RecA-family ATPase
MSNNATTQLPEVENNNNISGSYISPEWLTVEPQKQEFCIYPYAPIGAVTLMVAHGGVGKSLIALKMAIHTCLGLDIFGAKTSGCKVAYLSLEDPTIVLRERLHKIFKSMPSIQPRITELTQKLMLIDRCGKPIRIVDEDGEATKIADSLIDLLKVENIKCVFIDTLIRTHNLNENDNSQMGALLGVYEKIAETANCSVFILHHKPKNSSSQSYAARGVSSITDNTRSALSLERIDSKYSVNYCYDGSKILAIKGEIVKVTHTKHNYSAEHPEQYMEISKDGTPIEIFFISCDDREIIKQRYEELYAWWGTDWECKPLTKTNIEENINSIRLRVPPIFSPIFSAKREIMVFTQKIFGG